MKLRCTRALIFVAKIRDGEEQQGDAEYAQERADERSSMAFSIMCMFLTVLYLAFAATVYIFSHSVLEENEADEESLRGQQQQQHASHVLSNNAKAKRGFLLFCQFLSDVFDERRQRELLDVVNLTQLGRRFRSGRSHIEATHVIAP